LSPQGVASDEEFIYYRWASIENSKQQLTPETSFLLNNKLNFNNTTQSGQKILVKTYTNESTLKIEKLAALHDAIPSNMVSLGYNHIGGLSFSLISTTLPYCCYQSQLTKFFISDIDVLNNTIIAPIEACHFFFCT